jgi:flavin reductase (DIM6/NTAB) family NADH-FMN oxidoreductase RutF
VLPQPQPAEPQPADTPIDEAVFRRAMGRFAAGVCVLSARDGNLDHAMTASAVTSVSLDPLLVLVCVETDARFHDVITRVDGWAISVLDGTARPAAQWLSTAGRPLHGQLDRLPHRRGRLTGAALMHQSLATLECRTSAIHPGGDHSIVVGEVLGAEFGPEDSGALLHYRGEYRRLD